MTDIETEEFSTVEPIWRGGHPYFTEEGGSVGFIPLQTAVDTAIATFYHPSKTMPSAISRTKPMPWPKYTEDSYLTILLWMLPFIMTISFAAPVVTVSMELAIEKYSRIREAMLMMGLPVWINWAAWYLQWWIQLTVLAIFMTLVFALGGLLTHSTPLAIFLLLEFTIMALIAFGFVLSSLLSSLFQSPVLTGLGTFFVWMLAMVPYWSKQSVYSDLSFNQKLVMCLSPPAALNSGFRLIHAFELSGEGLHLANLASPPTSNDDFSMADCLGMLLLDTFIFLVLNWYLDKVFPGPFGVPQSPTFFLKPSYWGCGNLVSKVAAEKRQSMASTELDNRTNWGDFEPMADGTEVGIRMKHVVKEFETPTGTFRAVNDLSFDVAKGQVTAFLGHNGAGKTTTMSMMTGMIPPTAGTVEVNGHNVQTELKQARTSLGFCPQFDIIFDNLTVYEHLYFYLRLKGARRSDKAFIKKEVDQFLNDMNIASKRKAKAKTLSGGQKRALSVSIALIGGSKTVILDEPTSGMDPEKRRHTWDLINKHKPGRTILFTTHFMEEADLLGDRIAIMTKGHLSTVGSSLFLKNRFGVGYHITMTKGKGFKESEVMALFKGLIPTAKTLSNVGTEMTYLLPESAASKFPNLFRELEAQKAKLGLEEFGCSSTTMEEVFLQVGEQQEHKEKLEEEGKVSEIAETGADTGTTPPAYVKPPAFRASLVSAEGGGHKAYVDSTPPPDQRNTGVTLWLQRTKALFVKRSLHSKRHRATLLCQTVLPTLLVFASLATTHFKSSAQTDPVAQCRSLAPSGKTVYSGANTADYDDFIYMSGSTAAAFSAITAMGTTATQTALQNATEGLCGDMNKLLRLPSTGSNSLTEAIQTDAGDDFLRTIFYKKNVVGSTYHQGATYVTYSPQNGGECVFSGSPLYDNDVTGHGATALAHLDLMEGVSYVFKYGGGDSGNLYNILTQATTFMHAEIPTYCCETLNEWDYCDREVTTECAYFDDRDGGKMLRVMSGFDDPNLKIVCKDPANESQSATVTVSVTNDTGAAYAPPGTAVFAWYSPKLLHSPAEAVNLVGNTIARAHTGNDKIRILTNNCPLRKTTAEEAEDKAREAVGDGTSIMLFLSCAIAALAASYITFVVEERALHAKHIQFVSGATEYMYWAGTWAWDVINLQLPLLLIFLVYAFFTFKTDQYRGDNLGYLYLMMFVGFPGLLPMQYCLAWLFTNRTSAYAFSFIGFGLLTFAQLLTCTIMRVPELNALDTGKLLHRIFLFFPNYAIVDGIIHISANHDFLETCTAGRARWRASAAGSGSVLPAGGDDDDDGAASAPCKDIRYNKNYLASDGGIGDNLLFCVFDLFIWFFILFLIEWWKRAQCSRRSAAAVDPTEDKDVVAERQRVEQMGGGTSAGEQDQLIVKGLTKKFGSHRAVDGLSFGIPRGQCFGLLGVNGAGKTTTFRMLTGEINMSSGGIELDGFDVASELKKVRQRVGYCPQYDGLIHTMSGTEMLWMYARLRGIKEADIDRVVKESIEHFDLENHCERLCGTYSGGNKRKLATAIALMGSPPVIFLDEPTTGMDPGARRGLWDSLAAVTRAGKSIVLTTHSMEECEALCHRLAIMKKGTFRCIGTPQHLKSRFGRGYTLICKLPHGEDTVAEFVSSLTETFPGTALKERFGGELTFDVPGDAALSSMFEFMEKTKKSIAIPDYSISQTSLEQIFVSFAKDEEERRGSNSGIGAGGAAAEATVIDVSSSSEMRPGRKMSLL